MTNNVDDFMLKQVAEQFAREKMKRIKLDMDKMEELVEEYERIVMKCSKLSKSERDKVVAFVHKHLNRERGGRLRCPLISGRDSLKGYREEDYEMYLNDLRNGTVQGYKG